jgi:hypothetical protein
LWPAGKQVNANPESLLSEWFCTDFFALLLATVSGKLIWFVLGEQ